MKCILIHGPEASGKLTVARSLQLQTGFKLFHNHVSIDVGRTLYEYGEANYDELVFAVRLLVLESAAKHGVSGLIFTWAYTDPECRDMHATIVAKLMKYGVKIDYVYLKCEQTERERRVVQADRTQGRKIDSVEQLHQQILRKNCVPIPDVDVLTIDNTYMSASEAAAEITHHFQLKSTGSYSE